MMTRSLSVYLACLVASLFLVTAAASAGTKQEAKKHFESGLALLEAEDYNGAAAEFRISVEMYPTKNGYFNLANCYKALHRYCDAIEAIEKLKSVFEGELDEDWLDEIADFEKKMKSVVAKLEIEVSPDGASVLVDGRDMGESPLSDPLILGPGEHEISVSLKGYETEKRVVELVSGSNETETFELKKETSELKTETIEPEKEPAQTTVEVSAQEPVSEEVQPVSTPDGEEEERGRVWTWLAFGLGGAAGAAAVVTGSVQLSKASEIKGECDGNDCPIDLKDDGESARRLGIATNVLIGAAATFVVLGTVLLFVEGDGTDEEKGGDVAIAPTVNLSGAGVSITGRF